MAWAAYQSTLLDSHGPVGRAESTILIDSLAIMLAIVIPTIVATFIVAWWYRASNPRARYQPTWSFHGGIELVVWSVPFMVVILLAGVTWIGSHQLDPAKPLASDTPPLEIEVVSTDWKWLFIYPRQKIATVNRVVVPTGTPLHFSLTSASVMNSFFVPQLGSMIYTMNGMMTELNLQADEPGRFEGLSAQFSGEGFADMRFELLSVPADQFAEWVQTVRDNRTELNAAGYAQLTRQSARAPVSSYGTIDPDLFHKIVTLELPPGSGPATQSSGAVQASRVER